MDEEREDLPSVIVITDWGLGREVLLQRLDAALSLGPRVAVQHRHPEVTARQFVDEARAVRDLCQREHNPLFINGRLDVALLLGAHLHLPAGGLLPSDVRPHLPRDRMLSIAVHDEAEAQAARGADLALISPVYPAGSKPDDRRPPLGPAGFDRLAQIFGRPSYALGGITADRAGQLPEARGFAVISAVLRAPDPRTAALSLLVRGRDVLA